MTKIDPYFAISGLQRGEEYDFPRGSELQRGQENHFPEVSEDRRVRKMIGATP
jgi:hypothetical protein